MSIAKGEKLKQAFADRWKKGVKRELLVWNIINLYLPEDYIALFTGIGSGSGEYVNGNYDNPLNAFDIVIVDENMKIMAYLEITGTRDLEKGEELCIGAWKIFKAERFNVQDKVWYIHVLSSKIPIRVINYHRLKKIASFGQLHETSLVCGKFYCSKTSKWGSINDLIRWIKAKKQ